ncbi:3-oxoacyl-ACP synthase III family protein [Taibaiella chishuiensis]|uniref:3-oxoacyl-[acyl-carrier-protein] synthase-3 n=1 Tax=Taibaiella chishuiensis TaxID=1434707 RepID=A0A2P8D5I5_9BACT|nr:ketoacyl-ACP synthase III [Taibaiella chishuiensis]PSK92476.1 3-oxoacyl-[acyl-carrier-protein] synthase-3 [Taibaiella chishuiensis]
MSILLSGTASYIPERTIDETIFLQQDFYNEDGSRIETPGEEIIKKFRSITGIRERRYVQDNQKVSDIGTAAAAGAIEDAGIDPEALDGIICAHNYGDVEARTKQSDMVPSIAARIKHNLRIKNPACVAFDVLFGCPGWVQGVIIASQFLQNGAARRFLVVGAETLSRVVDPYDRDSMIYADGAAAAIIEKVPDAGNRGILSYASETHAFEEVYYLHFGPSYKPGFDPDTFYIKMHGRKIYEFALNKVPQAMKACLDQSGIAIDEVKKVFLHQANEKMDEAIIHRFYKLYGKRAPEDIMPMSIHFLGNSSVATVPTLFDLVRKGSLGEHQLQEDDVVLLASIGAGMNINAITYRV